MGVYHRDYMRAGFRGESQSSGPRSWSIVTWLIVINVAVFVVQRVIAPEVFLIANPGGKPIPLGGLSLDALAAGRIWLIPTHMFVHNGLMHLGANMLVLHFAGRGVLAILGRRHLLMIYFCGGLLGAAAQLSYGVLIDQPIYLYGASGGVIATLIALAVLTPEEEVYLLVFFVIPVRMRMKTVGRVMVGFDLVMLTVEVLGIYTLGIGHLAHLGGALFGWLYVKRGFSETNQRRPSSEQTNRWLSRFGGNQVVDAEMADSSGEKKSWFKSSKPQAYISGDVDRILEKISKEGMQSLSDEERKILEKSSEKLAKMTNRLDRDT